MFKCINLIFALFAGFLSFTSVTNPDRRPLVASQLHQMKSVMSQLVAQQVDPTEFSCLKALALFRPGSLDFPLITLAKTDRSRV